MTPLKALQQAVDLVGGQSALAKRCAEISKKRVTQQNVWSWLNRSKRVPPEFVLTVERASDGKVSRHELGPEIYPRERARPALPSKEARAA